MSSQLPGIFQSLAPTLDKFGYAAVIVLVGLEGVGIPLPGQIILVAAGMYAGVGHLHLALVLLAGFVAAVVGDNAGYAIEVPFWQCLDWQRLIQTCSQWERAGHGIDGFFSSVSIKKWGRRVPVAIFRKRVHHKTK